MTRSSTLLFLALLAAVAGCAQAQSRSLMASPVQLDTTFNVLIRCGDERPDASGKKKLKLGAIVDKKWRPVLDSTGAARTTGKTDFTSYHKTPKGIRTVVQMEDSPAPYYVLGVEQDAKGHLRVNNLQLVDISKWEGSVRPCAGSITPWGTHLGGEESYPDVKPMTEWLKANDVDKVAGSADVRNLLNWHGYYLGAGTADDEYLKGNCSAIGTTYIPGTPEGKAEWFKLFKTVYKPFMIGHVFEIDVRTSSPKFGKHLALGRSSFELALVMPDQKTVYLTDDAVAGGFMKFIADKKGDLSKGTLYAGKFKQTSPDNSTDNARWDIKWIKLSYVDGSVVEKQARKPLSDFNFDSIFLSAPFNVSCPAGYKRIDWQFTECLKLNTATPNVEMLAAALETRRYIPYVGATTEFSKMEGLTYDAKGKKLYMAMSYQRALMTTETPEAPGQNDVRVQENTCGCVYALDVDASYVAKNMYVEFCGQKITVNGTETCDMSSTSNPDNLDMMDGFPWLIVSEDTDYRKQDLMMAHNVVTKENIIIAAAETDDSEVTAGYVHTLGEYTYITANFQGFDTSPIGYLGPYKLKGVKEVTFKPHVPKGPEYVNKYAPFRAPKGGKSASKGGKKW